MANCYLCQILTKHIQTFRIVFINLYFFNLFYLTESSNNSLIFSAIFSSICSKALLLSFVLLEIEQVDLSVLSERNQMQLLTFQKRSFKNQALVLVVFFLQIRNMF